MFTLVFFENHVNLRDYYFEDRVWIVQPFIDTLDLVDDQEMYSSVRAIVCDGKFIDAYMRTNFIPVVNYAKGADSHKFERDGFSELCEKIVLAFETECEKYSEDDFKHELYTKSLVA